MCMFECLYVRTYVTSYVRTAGQHIPDLKHKGTSSSKPAQANKVTKKNPVGFPHLNLALGTHRLREQHTLQFYRGQN